jgi:hypothetical protein
MAAAQPTAGPTENVCLFFWFVVNMRAGTTVLNTMSPAPSTGSGPDLALRKC